MTGLTQLLSIGESGLLVATQAMQAVANNTANVNTPGYAVESIDPAELPANATGGSGVQVTAIKRAFNQFIYEQMVQASSASQAAQVTQASAQNLSTLFPVTSGGANGLGAALSSFFAAVNQVAQDPSSGPYRTALLTNAQSLAADFNTIGSQLTSQLRSIDAQATSSVQQINQLTQQIANLNAQITAQSAPGAHPDPSLLNNRDDLIQRLGQQIGVTIVSGANGAVNVYTSGGAALVNGSSATQLAAGPSTFGDGGVTVTYGPNGQDLTNAISGGTLGGLATARTQVASALDNVGAFSVALADGINTQQSLGLDLNGNLGAPIFSVGTPTVFPAQSNTGSGTLSATITNPSTFVPGDFVLLKTASGFQVANLATGQTTTLGNGPTLSLDGMTITVSGSVAVGDQFKLEPTATAAQSLAVTTTDPSAIAAAAPYVVAAGDNAGTVQATTSSPIAASTLPVGTAIVPAAQFGKNLSIAFTSATTFQVLGSGNAVVASGSFSPSDGAEIGIAYPSPPAASGMVTTISLSPGTAVTGDTFAVTTSGPGNNGNIAAMAGLSTAELLSGQSLADNYSALVTTIGINGHAAGVAAQAADAVFSQAQSAQQSISGVNLDEQAANLVNYQQAYQASATVIATVQTLFQSLLAAASA
jgi:flagellar hook-associated protein 1 FlgK